MPSFDEYEEFFDDDDSDIEELDEEDLKRLSQLTNNAKQRSKKYDLLNDIGVVPKITPENMERRLRYEKDYVAAHHEVFTESTGIKPLGLIQRASVERTAYVLAHGGKSVIAEPRGFGKTSRTANNALMGVLQGKVSYVLILASSVQKAEDILESIKTELLDNEHLYDMYPATCECFRHGTDNQARISRQTYLGERTFFKSKKDMIIMPVIPGEPSSGAIIQVRSKDNVRGLAVKVKGGDNSRKVLRPDFVFMDDIQTDEEAESPTSVYKIIQTIKKSVLFGGSHSRRVSALMCCTPICPGDVSSHFILNESSWDCLVSPMIIQMPTNIDMWLNDYARLLLDFDRYATGDRTRAQLAARAFVEENYEKMHEGAKWAWDWAYGWAEDPQTEISPLQHAMNFRIEEGDDAFESECQCNVQMKIDEAEGVKATLDEIINKIHSFPKNHCPVDSAKITTHIDVNKEVLTYVTVASPTDYRPHIIDYGTWPEQPGSVWRKNDLGLSLTRFYPKIPEHHERIYVGVKELVNKLGAKEYHREDGLVMHNDLISVDMGYMIDEVQRGIRDSDYKGITMCYRGQGIKAKAKQFMDRHYEKQSEKHFHCATVPTTDKLLKVLYTDVNYFKTLVHKGFKTREGIGSSLSLFTPERSGEHLLFARQCLVEVATDDYDEKDDRHVIVWENIKKEDNEAFDNVVGACAMLFKLGVAMRGTTRKKRGTYNLQDYIEGNT